MLQKIFLILYSIVILGIGSTRAYYGYSNDIAQQIEIAKQLSKFETLEEYYKFLNITKSPGPNYDGFGIMERSSGFVVAKPAMCKPELQVVPVKEDHDPSYVYVPDCVRMKRCGGCCHHERLKCEPIGIETVNYRVLRKQVFENTAEHEIVPLEEHTACECKCKIKANDCSYRHYYNETECGCICKNRDEEEKCIEQRNIKYWDFTDCTCKCRKVEKDCSTGSYFDEKQCRCLNISKPWYNDYVRSTGYYNIGQNVRQKDKTQIVFVPDATDPRRRHREDPEY